MRKTVSVLLVILLSLLSFSRNRIWQSDGTIWADTIAQNPENARAYNELGLYLASTGDYEEALRIMNISLALNPYQPTVYVNIGFLLERANLPDQAEETYHRAIRYYPQNATAYYNLGILYYSRFQDRDRALRSLLTARDLDPLEADVHHYLSRIYLEKGDRSRAEEENRLYHSLKHR